MSWRASGFLFAIAVLCAPSANAQAVERYARVNADSPIARDLFGGSLGLSGTTLVVGAPGDDESGLDTGSVYVFERDYLAGEIWVQTARLAAPAPAFGDRFGATVAIEDDILIVGAPGRDVAGVLNSGEVFAFERTGSVWGAPVSITPPGVATSGDQIGGVALSGSTLVVGAPLADSVAGVDTGRAWTFERTGPLAWSFDIELTMLPLLPLVAGDQFGSVDIEGDALIVGAWERDVLDGPITLDNAGAAYVFERVAGTWGVPQFITGVDGVGAVDARVEDGFGQAVAIDNGLVAVGARRYDLPGLLDSGGSPVLESNSGAVFVFERGGVDWQFKQRIVPPGVFEQEEFGNSVVIENGLIVVGSASDNVTGMGFPAIKDRGRVFMFREDAMSGIFRGLGGVNAYDGIEGDFFGNRVAISGDLIAAGAVLDDAGQSLQFAGSCYVFEQEFTPEPVGNFRNSCLGDGANPFMGAGNCTPCLCAGDSAEATWGGCTNSASVGMHGGAGARLVASGVPSIAADSLRFEMVHGVDAAFGILVSGTLLLPNNPGANPCTGLATGLNTALTLDGLRCVGGTVRRHGGRMSDANGRIGISNRGWGPPDNPMAGIADQANFVAGQTRHFQVNQRDDPALACMNGVTTTQAISITFLP